MSVFRRLFIFIFSTAMRYAQRAIAEGNCPDDNRWDVGLMFVLFLFTCQFVMCAYLIMHVY